MVQNQRRGGNGSAIVMLIVGGIAGAVVEFVQNVILFYVLPNTSRTGGYVVDAIEGLVTGAVIGGAVLLGRPRNHGIAAATGAVAFLAGAIGDEASRLVLAVIHDWLVSTAMFTGYFTQHTPTWWAIDLIPILVAAGLAALGVSKNARTPLAPPPGTPGPWGPQASFGGPPHPGMPYPTPGQAPYGPGVPGGQAPQAPGVPVGQAPQAPGVPGGQAPWGPGPQQPQPSPNPPQQPPA